MQTATIIDGRLQLNQPAVVSETIDGEAVIINLDKGTYYSLRETGAYIWGLLEQGTTTRELLAGAERTFAADDRELRADLLAFLSELAEEELIRCEHGEADAAVAADTATTTNSHERKPFVRPVLDKYTDMEHLLLLDPIHEIDETGWIHLK